MPRLQALHKSAAIGFALFGSTRNTVGTFDSIGSIGSAGGAGGIGGAGGAGGIGGAGSSPARQKLVDAAEYDPATRAPANAAAEALVQYDWHAGVMAAAAGGRGVVQLPFAELERATHGFDEFNRLGDGASCVVFRGLCYGRAVAVKVVLLANQLEPRRHLTD
jgi:hypothetical protein